MSRSAVKKEKLALSAREQWLISRVSGKRIVDIGFAGEKEEAPAYISAIARKCPGSQFIGVDLSYEAVYARRQPGAVVGNGKQLPLKAGSASCVILGELLEHHTDILDFLREANRVLAPGGKLIITTPNPFFIARVMKHWLAAFGGRLFSMANVSSSMGSADHVMLRDPLSLCNFVSHSGFELVELTSIGIWFPWLGRLIPALRRSFYANFWPLNRLAYITCLVATKK